MSSVKFAKLRAALKRQADENREHTQENLKKAEEVQKQLITAKLQKWAVIKSGQGRFLIARKYGLNQTQESLDVDKFEKVIEKLSKLLNTVAAKYPGEEASLRKRIEEYKKLMDEKKRNEIAQAAIANGEVISHSDFERLEQCNLKIDQLLRERSELVNQLNEIDEAKSQELQKLVDYFSLSKKMEDSKHVELELQLEMPVIRQGMKELANGDSSVFDAVLARISPVIDELKAKYNQFNAIRKTQPAFDELISRYEIADNYQKSAIMHSMFISDENTGQLQLSSEFEAVERSLTRIIE
ncbi:unnamed protein product [Oikopleura dioica]|uniref:Uncharacterized protein n=1 Tax=Oikopleura dioica TaxID=34765 RepID=E4X4V4_OIKDI|nr:unnamed protein product [Oikopleura dioica]